MGCVRLGAYQATVAADRTEVLVTGVDGQEFAIAEVAKGGNWIATVRQDWPVISATVLDLIEGQLCWSGTSRGGRLHPGGRHHRRERLP